MEYMSASQAAEKWGISVQRVRLLCQEGRILGMERVARTYLIPKDAEKPKDARIKSGKYIKSV